MSLCIIFPVKIYCPASILLMSVTCIPGQHFALKYYQTWLLFFHTFKFVAKLFDSSTCSVGRSSNSASLWHQQPKESNSGTGRKESQHYFIWCQQWVHLLCCVFWIEFGASLSNQLLQKIFLISLLLIPCQFSEYLNEDQIWLSYFRYSGSGASSGPGPLGHLLQPGPVLLCRFTHLCAGKHLQGVCWVQCWKSKEKSGGKSF